MKKIFLLHFIIFPRIIFIISCYNQIRNSSLSLEITQAINQISELFHLALNGEEIIITENQQPLLKLTALKSKSQRPPLFGTDKDIISIADNFDAPLEEFAD